MRTTPDLGCAYPLFQQPWLLDAVARGGCEEITVTQNGRVLARLPYVRRRRRGLTVLGRPPLTQTLGPWIDPPRGKPASTLGQEMALLSELAERIPPADRFLQAFPPQLLKRDAVPLGRLPPRAALHAPGRAPRRRRRPDGSVRGTLRKARRRVAVRTDLGMAAFYDAWAMTFGRQGLAPPYFRAQLERNEAAGAARGAREILSAVDADGPVHAVSYVVFDRNTVYHLLSRAGPALRRSRAATLLLWEAIRRVARLTEVFDFEGSMLQGVECVNRRFGARQAPYLIVARDGRRMRAAMAVRELVRAAAGRPAA